MKRRREPASQLTVFNLEYLVDMIRRGRIRIPPYARRYVWNRDQVIALIDSIARGYPVGTLLFSEGPAPEEEVHFGPITVHAPAEERAYWVIDGQQRLVTIAASLLGGASFSPSFSISYDVRSDSFVSNPKPNDPLYISLPDLFDGSNLGFWLMESGIDPESIDLVTDISNNIRRFQFAVYIIQHDDPMVAIEIFERLNTSGVTLSASELFSALATGPQASAGGRARRIEEIAHSIASQTDFGLIDEATIMRAILSVRTDEINYVSTIPVGELQESYDESHEPLFKAVSFLQEAAEVPHFTFLAYRYLLIVLTRFFALHPSPDARNVTLLRRWFWRATVAGTRSSSGSSSAIALRRALGAIGHGRTSESVQSMLRRIDQPNQRFPSIRRFNARTAPTRILSCSWWSQRPRDPRNGKAFSKSEISIALGSSKSAGRVLPAIFRNGKDLSSLSANHLLLPIKDESVDEIDTLLSIPRFRTTSTEWQRVLRSHAMTDEAAALLRRGDISEFLNIREGLIDRDYRVFIAAMCEWDFEDTPPLTDLVIDDGDEYDDTTD
jgi:hypothetical protein